jgi:hypothetical protein
MVSVLSCGFDGLLASCRMSLGGIPLEVSARINHCHTPIDVTFLVQSDSTLIKGLDTPDTDDDDAAHTEVSGRQCDQIRRNCVKL